MVEDSGHAEKRRRIDRVTAACDLCKQRKVKCDGALPCSYCQRKKRADTCTFSGAKPRQTKSTGNSPANPSETPTGDQPSRPRHVRRRSGPVSLLQRTQGNEDATNVGTSLSPVASREDQHEDTDVPLEGRLLRDAQGRGDIFLGDCAPLSFLQTVRHLIAAKVDPNGFAPQASRDSIVEVAQPIGRGRDHAPPSIGHEEIKAITHQYYVSTSGLLTLFDIDVVHLLSELVRRHKAPGTMLSDVVNAVPELIIAIGLQEIDEPRAETFFLHARNSLVTNIGVGMNLVDVQGFILISFYMLRACQPNGAYMYVSLGARAAYAIGLHRTEVNASTEHRTMRDRIWKSLRVIDMLVSNMLGRPTATSDVDCTVKYSLPEAVLDDPSDALDACTQMFMIIERIVIEVYSRKRISTHIAGVVSHKLKTWAAIWNRPLSQITRTSSSVAAKPEMIIGACQTLCTYYYSIMLLTRPFLMYDLYEYLGASLRGQSSRAENLEKRRFADAASDAAVTFVETLQTVIESGMMPRKMPMIVSWLFPTSLVLAVGTLGRSGLALEATCRRSIECLDYFGKHDPQARNYSLIVQALLTIATENVKKRELQLRSEQKQASSQLFGLLPPDSEHDVQPIFGDSSQRLSRNDQFEAPDMSLRDMPPDWTFYDTELFTLPWTTENDQGLQDFLQPGRQTMDGSLADIPLFPLFDQAAESRGPYSGQAG